MCLEDRRRGAQVDRFDRIQAAVPDGASAGGRFVLDEGATIASPAHFTFVLGNWAHLATEFGN